MSKLNTTVFSLFEKELWSTYIKKLPLDQQDIYFTPEYYKLYEDYGDGQAHCFVFQDGTSIALYPFLLNSVNKLGYNLDEEYYDIQGAYGYNGVISNDYSESFISKFYSVFNEFCLEKKIIAEFTRFHPLLKNHNFSKDKCDVVFNQNNVVVNLFSNNILKEDYEYSTRKNINKALNSGLLIQHLFNNEISSKDIENFYQVYYHTMNRNNADDFYYFNTNFFNKIFLSLKNSLLTFVYYKDIVISCELVLLGSNIAYSFLGGTLSQYFNFRPNDFLKHHVIFKLKEIGYKYFLLGGGSEGVYKYKKSFSKNGVIPFFIGKKIHNQIIYKEVVSQWEEKFPEKEEKYKNLILKYRY